MTNGLACRQYLDMRPLLALFLVAACTYDEGVGRHAAPSVIGATRWARPLGGADTDRAMAVAMAADGSVVAAGHFGSRPTTGFIARFDDEGELGWLLSTGGNSEVMDVAIDPSGAIVATGRYSGVVHFGEATTPNDPEGIFIVKLAQDGTPIWLRSFATVGWGRLELDALGRIYTSGWFSGSLDLGGGAVQSFDERADVYLAALSPDGDVLWWMSARGPDHQTLSGMATDPSGGVVIAGSFVGSFDLAGVSMTASPVTSGFVASFGPAGELRWSRALEGTEPEALVHAGDEVTVAGRFVGTDALFLLTLSGSGETLRESARAGGLPHPSAMVATEGGLIVGGFIEGARADFVNSELLGPGMFLAAFAPDGSAIDAATFGSFEPVGPDMIRGIDGLRDGQLVAVGEFHQSIDVGTGPMTSEGDSDAIVFKLGLVGDRPLD